MTAYLSHVRRVLLVIQAAFFLASAFSGKAASGGILKVLPEFLDLKARTSLTPSLYERDAYQSQLLHHPEKRSGMRFYVQWKTKGAVWAPLVVRLELRGRAEGNLPKQLVIDQPVQNPGGWFGHWAEINLVGEKYKTLGVVTSWRVSLWEGNELLGMQQSFLW